MTVPTFTALQRLAALLDASLSAGGWQRTAALGSVSWTRTIADRDVLLKLSAQSRTRYSGEVRYRQRLGYRLRCEISTAAPVRVFFVRGGFADNALVRWIWRLRGQYRVENSSAHLDGFVVGATDPIWARALVMDSQAMTDIATLLRDGASPSLAGSVHLGPKRLYYCSPILPADAISVERANTLVVQMTCIAERIDSLPPTSKPSRESALERLSRKHPMLAALVILGAGLALLGGVAASIAVIAFLLNR